MEELNIGKKIQDFRNARNTSVRELSKKSGITASMLSQIERGLVNPSINTLRSIANTLDVPLFYFFKEDPEKEELVVRKNNRKTIGFPNQSDVRYDLLVPNTLGTIEFCMMEIPNNSKSVEKAESHKGEEVAYVIEGRVDIIVAGIRYSLDEGDSIRIPPMTDHKWENIDTKLAKVIFAVTPPSF